MIMAWMTVVSTAAHIASGCYDSPWIPYPFWIKLFVILVLGVMGSIILYSIIRQRIDDRKLSKECKWFRDNWSVYIRG